MMTSPPYGCAMTREGLEGWRRTYGTEPSADAVTVAEREARLARVLATVDDDGRRA